MSLRRDFKRESKLVVGKLPEGVEVDTDVNNRIIISYDPDDEKQWEWVSTCEARMDQRYNIWIHPVAKAQRAQPRHEED